jgi:signal transduction histidine kinase
LACPIQDDQFILGDIWLMKPAHEQFTDLEIRLAEQVANQCAIALRQARLFKAAQAQVVELERLNQLKDDFLSTVSHELRTPMASIKMATEMLEIYLQRLQLLDEPAIEPINLELDATGIKRYFQILKDEGNREISLINDLLDLARIDAQAEPLNLMTIRLQDWIFHCLETWMQRAERHQLSLTAQIPPDLPSITTDLSYLQRILSELVNNACKYTPPHESITIAIQATTIFKIQVSNSGVEISPDERDRIFERFYRIPNTDPWRYEGTGLGLALVKKLVEYLGGTIDVESSDRQTHFIIHLPFEAPISAELPHSEW